ncbi:2TM domain-containing protein [Seonamhaeicola marinus]|nr:2TM domain-containing protein [Seonamhaeicola marinus]
MESDKNYSKKYLKAKEKVRRVKWFYFHLVGYIIVVVLLLYNIYILGENNPYANFFLWFNSLMILFWTIFIILHGRWALRNKTFFSKKWESKKAEEFLEKENNTETTMWE